MTSTSGLSKDHWQDSMLRSLPGLVPPGRKFVPDDQFCYREELSVWGLFGDSGVLLLFLSKERPS